jgi:hypothetical protein
LFALASKAVASNFSIVPCTKWWVFLTFRWDFPIALSMGRQQVLLRQ